LAAEVLENRVALESQSEDNKNNSSIPVEASNHHQRFSRVSLEELVMRNFARKLPTIAGAVTGEPPTASLSNTNDYSASSPVKLCSQTTLSPNRNETLDSELSRLRAREAEANQEIERLSEQVMTLETYGFRVDQQLLLAEQERSHIESRLEAIISKVGAGVIDDFDSIAEGDEITRRKSPSDLTITLLSDDGPESETSQRDSINSDMSGSVLSGSLASQTMPKAGREDFLLQKLRRRDASLERIQQEKIDLSSRCQAQSQELRRLRQKVREERACFEEDARTDRLKLEDMLSENVQLSTELGTVKSQLAMLQQQQQLQFQRNLIPSSRNGTPPRNPFTSLIQSPADINGILDTWREVQTGCRPTPTGSPLKQADIKMLVESSPLLKMNDAVQFLQTPITVGQVLVDDVNNENATPHPELFTKQPVDTSIAIQSDRK